MSLHIRRPRLRALPESLRQELVRARHRRHWSQSDLGQQLGLPQTHISAIETGKTAPRIDTLLDLVRVLEYDLLLIPRTLIPAVQALIRDNSPGEQSEQGDEGEKSLYANNENEELE